MVNIIREADNFIFVHIPKCGGSSIAIGLTEALDPPLEDEIRYDGAKLDTIEGLGSYMDAHKPLWMLRDHFPEELETYRRCECFCVVRDPHKRFASAVQQYLREFEHNNIADMAQDDVIRVLDTLMERLSTENRYLGGEYVHFIAQDDFVTLEGERIVKNIYPLEELDAMALHISDVVQRPVRFHFRANTSAGSRGKSFKLIKRIGKPLRAVIPAGLYWSLKTAVIKALTKPLPQDALSVFETDRVKQFVETYYAKDIALYAEAQHAFAQQRSA